MRRSPLTLELNGFEQTTLEHWSRSPSCSNGLAQRARMVLLFVGGKSIRQIALQLDYSRQIVRMWLTRFKDKRLEGLQDLTRPGRPVTFSPGGGFSTGQVRLSTAR